MVDGFSIELKELKEGSHIAPMSSNFLSIDETIYRGRASGDPNGE